MHIVQVHEVGKAPDRLTRPKKTGRGLPLWLNSRILPTESLAGFSTDELKHIKIPTLLYLEQMTYALHC